MLATIHRDDTIDLRTFAGSAPPVGDGPLHERPLIHWVGSLTPDSLEAYSVMDLEAEHEPLTVRDLIDACRDHERPHAFAPIVVLLDLAEPIAREAQLDDEADRATVRALACSLTRAVQECTDALATSFPAAKVVAARLLGRLARYEAKAVMALQRAYMREGEGPVREAIAPTMAKIKVGIWDLPDAGLKVLEAARTVEGQRRRFRERLTDVIGPRWALRRAG